MAEKTADFLLRAIVFAFGIFLIVIGIEFSADRLFSGYVFDWKLDPVFLMISALPLLFGLLFCVIVLIPSDKLKPRH